MSEASIPKDDRDHIFGPPDKPTYDCELVPGTNSWRFFCPKCKVYHYHGPSEGHRVAHCGDRRAHPNGYYLRIDEEYV